MQENKIIENVSNQAIFNRIWQMVKNVGLSFVSSNGGTGKTIFFRFRLLFDALFRDIPFNLYVRYGNEMEELAESFLTIKQSYSQRQVDMLKRLTIKKTGKHFVYLYDTETDRKIAQIPNIYGHDAYKKHGSTINAKRALFDEVQAENGSYCPEEISRFNRLNGTMMRSNDYKVICLYNNTSPNFDYFKFFGGKSFETHVSDNGTLFVFFIAPQFKYTDFDATKDGTLQSIMAQTAYSEVYNSNKFTQYPAYFYRAELKDSPIFYKLEVENKLFKVRKHNGMVFLDSYRGYKPSTKPIFTVNETYRTEYPQLPQDARYALSRFRDKAILKTNRIEDTIFVKKLCEII